MNARKIIHVCEVCGKMEVLTAEEGFENGWDYPPRMGEFKVVSPRTCGDCGMTETLWWAVTFEGKRMDELTDAQKDTLERILQEPESIYFEGKGEELI